LFAHLQIDKPPYRDADQTRGTSEDMKPQNEESGWKQHFPTYRFRVRDIALEEYKFATKTLEAEERVFLNAANLSVIVGAALGSLALGSLEKLARAFVPTVPEVTILGIVLLLAGGFAVLSLRYFADRQKAVVFAARKVIVLRRMLGMSYGGLQLVLPNWRIEGADNPFAVRLFPGWHTYVAYPCYAIAGISSAVAFFVLAALLKHVQASGTALLFDPPYLVVGVAASWFVVLSWIYRKALVDTHERAGLLIARRIASALHVKLVTNIEYVIYRATLGKYELHRLGVDLSVAKKFLVHIEDKEFFTHSGVSIRGLGRLFFSVLGRRRRSGGSTITQQLVRTLFIEDQSKLVRRKLIEILLARWLNKVFAKNDQLELYLASVRFEASVFGIAAAMKHFFGEVRKTLSPAEAFFLIERVSNIRSRLLVAKVDQTLRGAVAAGLLEPADAKQAASLYVNAVKSGRIQDPEGTGVIRLEKAWVLD
jgi:penicillin-binding protein 1A